MTHKIKVQANLSSAVATAPATPYHEEDEMQSSRYISGPRNASREYCQEGSSEHEHEHEHEHENIWSQRNLEEEKRQIDESYIEETLTRSLARGGCATGPRANTSRLETRIKCLVVHAESSRVKPH
ncbi:hypothetical protein CROQUDRAFT_713667 [Cronartium quercuum f. sp. fusiforme G11]|uniref:Uncharacterized protein n=1 Tax=Cronartium quercuum f. sp. fusiforme G11 TaxID=708437 RepID=A0A9P6NQV4_9BASI|nr:hypothetical protein CROQUDRAFT_713667 [Cronartium quercuum f. sp. fusiforme G11]